jgi:hypothetical protein
VQKDIVVAAGEEQQEQEAQDAQEKMKHCCEVLVPWLGSLLSDVKRYGGQISAIR